MQHKSYNRIIVMMSFLFFFLTILVIAKSVFLKNILMNLPPVSKTVSLCCATYGPYETTLEQRARLDPHVFSDLAAQVSGTIESIFVKPGQYVEKDTILASIDNRALLAQKEASIQNLEWNKKHYERIAFLLSQSVGTQEAYETAWTQYCSAQSAVIAASHNYELSIIKAPGSGYVSDFSWKEGSYIKSGQTFCQYCDHDAFEVVVGIPSKWNDSLKNLSHAEWIQNNISYPLRLWSQDSFVDPQSQKMILRFLTKENSIEDHPLYPGLWGRVRMTIKNEPCWHLPQEAIASDQKGLCVWIAIKNEEKLIAHRIPIEIVFRDSQYLYFTPVDQNWSEFNQVIVKGHLYLQEGDYLVVAS